MADSEQLPAWLTEGCVNFYANEFGRSRFVSGLNWYRNIDRNWELTAPIHRQRCFSEILVRGDFGCGSSFGFFTA